MDIISVIYPKVRQNQYCERALYSTLKTGIQLQLLIVNTVKSPNTFYQYFTVNGYLFQTLECC